MKSVLSKTSISSAVTSGYVFFFKNLFYVLRLVLPFLFVYLLLDISIKTQINFLGLDPLFYIKNFLIDFCLGAVLFSVARRVVLDENIFQMKLGEIFDKGRINALFISAFIFAVLQGGVSYCESQSSSSMVSQGMDASGIIVSLLFLYVALLLFIGSFVAIAIATQANILSYLYVAFRPRFMWMLGGIWSFTTFLFLISYYAWVFLGVHGGQFDIQVVSSMMEQTTVFDKTIFGLVKVCGFVIFVASMAHVSKFFLVFKNKDSEIIKTAKEMLDKTPENK